MSKEKEEEKKKIKKHKSNTHKIEHKDSKKIKKEAKTKVRKIRRKKSSKKVKKVAIARGKRKNAIARAYVRNGNGQIRINSKSISSIKNRLIKDTIMEPINLAGPLASKVNIKVNVYGGGVMGQAQAVRNAIAVGLVKFYNDEELRHKYLERDRFMIIEDSRRIESKKYMGPKSRARKQKSYR
ncbi:30S ribosomal protein S9 [Candidatus Micrarchaeota archaeon]|nr:30S ribosomal protein S9 [Candidatus Micrarchaeota archaeon]